MISFLQTVRSFSKNKVHTLINVFGLSLGLTATILAFIFVKDELTFDKFHSRADRMYRLNKIVQEVDGSTSLTAETSGLMGPTMADEFPEVDNIVRYSPWSSNVMLTYQEKNLIAPEDSKVAFVDSTFFEVFDFKLVRGDVKTVLSRPATIVLTEKTSQVLFGQEDPIGKTVIGMGDVEFEITGIVADPPRNSHLQFSGLASWTTTLQSGPIPSNYLNNWIAQALCTYVLLKEGTSHYAVEEKLGKFMKDHLPERADKYQLYLQPFKDVYLKSTDVNALRMSRIGNGEYIFLFSIIAGFILLIACINYINISTSKATRRAREVGMRKTLGATKLQLVRQFMGESLLITSCAVIIALAMLSAAIPFFNELAGKTIPAENLLDPVVGILLVGLIISVTIVSGIYPAFVISSFKPSEVLKATAKNKLTGNWARYALITFQFIVSITMIAGTLLVYQQVQYMLSKDLGFEKEHVLVVKLTNAMTPKGDAFQQDVNTLSQVVNTSLSVSALGTGTFSTYVVPENFAANEVEVRVFLTDFEFQKTYDLELVKGRFLDPQIASDSSAIVINETLAKLLSWNDPIQKTMRFNENGPAYRVVGVLKDFNFKSLYEEIEPLVLGIVSDNRKNLSIRFTGNPTDLLSSLEERWSRYEDRYPFQYYFVDQEFAKSYQSEAKLLKTIITFAGLSIIIACLGLYGLVSYTAEQRTKEFGIRKVLGASFINLNVLVNKKFVMMILLAAGIAIPILIPLVEKWLQKFAYKIEIGPATFIVSILITLAITIAAISIHSIKLAKMNPTDSLRHE